MAPAPGRDTQWIGSPTGTDPGSAPLLRREFEMNGPLVSATLLISGLGYYEACINGKRVGDHVLDPAQTDYEKRVFYVAYEVTSMITEGNNALGVMLGNGWYNQDRVWSETGLVYGRPRLLAELHLETGDGETIVLATEAGGWTCHPGPVTDNNIYAGETYDARLEQPGWCSPGFDDSHWEPVEELEPPGGRLELQNIPPIRRTELLRPLSITERSHDTCIVDMGQNFAGWAKIRLRAPAGATIRLRFAEDLTREGAIDTASTGVFATGVEQIDRYTCRGDGLEIWEPRFTCHGFRYVEVSGWPGKPSADDITGVAVHTDLKRAGAFMSSDARLNRLHNMAIRTHRSNVHGIPEDCPARERCGWLGDANVVCEYSLWNFHAGTFWKKFLGDIETTRALHDGLPCNVSPGKRTSKAKPDWAAAYIMIPWYLYLFEGDSDVFKKHWEGMHRLIEHFAESSQGWILEDGFGDWFDPGTDSPCTHTPPALTTTLWFYRCALVMSSAARVLGLPDAAGRYAAWASMIKEALMKEFYDPEHGTFGSQTADAMALHFEIPPADQEARVLNALVGDIVKRSTHLNTGIMGIRFLFEVLTRRGHGELALALMHQDSYPGLGDLIRRGATTLWEYWGELALDKKLGPRSLNHPMLGGFDNWFFNTLAGIRPDPANPGFRRFLLEPHPIRSLEWVRCRHESPYGRILSEWNDDGTTFEWTVAVPEGSVAGARLPYSGNAIELQPGRHRLFDAVPARPAGKASPHVQPDH